MDLPEIKQGIREDQQVPEYHEEYHVTHSDLQGLLISHIWNYKLPSPISLVIIGWLTPLGLSGLGSDSFLMSTY